MQIVQQIAADPEETFSYARYSRSPQLPNLELDFLKRTEENTDEPILGIFWRMD